MIHVNLKFYDNSAFMEVVNRFVTDLDRYFWRDDFDVTFSLKSEDSDFADNPNDEVRIAIGDHQDFEGEIPFEELNDKLEVVPGQRTELMEMAHKSGKVLLIRVSYLCEVLHIVSENTYFNKFTIKIVKW